MRVILIAATEIQELVPEYVFNSLTLKDMDELAEMAGRLCYESWGRPNPETATNEGYLKNIIDQGHFSVLEHASATFYIDGVSRNFTHELIRHRHLSFSEVSQRYVDVSKYRVVLPPALRQTIEDGKYFDEEYDPVTGTYGQDGTDAQYQYAAVMEELADLPRKAARQAARFALPGGLETKILVTGNMRAWRDVLIKRLSPTADLEFRLVAKDLLQKLRQISPNTFQDFEEVE